ncbi:MAG: VacJ family lipoprotein [Pseudomonadota bacterium]
MNLMHRCVLTAALCVSLAGCAGTPSTAKTEDPFENTNRAVHSFNTTVDRYSLKPVAKAYRAVLPGFARQGISNFYANLTTPASSLNNFLQGKPQSGMTELSRFVFNSTVGIGGLVDVSAMSGVEAETEDFGQTFAVWGVPSGPYIYLPFLGPSTALDVAAWPLDFFSNPVNLIDDTGTQDKLRVLDIIQIRAQLLAAEGLLEDADDPYIALREAYLQNRLYRIYDGDPPISDEEEDLFNEFFDEVEDD